LCNTKHFAKVYPSRGSVYTLGSFNRRKLRSSEDESTGNEDGHKWKMSIYCTHSIMSSNLEEVIGNVTETGATAFGTDIYYCREINQRGIR
jgi:hypothetical protein